MKILFMYGASNTAIQNQFLGLLIELMKIINDIEIISVTDNGGATSMEHARWFINNRDFKFLLVDESLKELPFEKIILKEGMTHEMIIREFGIATK